MKFTKQYKIQYPTTMLVKPQRHPYKKRLAKKYHAKNKFIFKNTNRFTEGMAIVRAWSGERGAGISYFNI
jgi:hypothetical protein